MKNIKYTLWFLAAMGVIFSISIANAQVESKNGYMLPPEAGPNNPIKVLIVYAELIGTCANDTPFANWPTGTALPPNADKYLDYEVLPSPTTFLSRYYRDISLGEHEVIGDYYHETVQVSCTGPGSGISRKAIKALHAQWQPAADGKYYTANGLTLDDFDDYVFSGSSDLGLYQAPGNSDGRLDAVIILWRNAYTCGSGLGVGNEMNEPLGNKSVKVYGSWGFCPNKLNEGYDRLFVTEYFHALYGHNNFHTGGGEDHGTYMFGGHASFSTSAQSGSSSNIVCGWDRHFLDWKGDRQFPISAENQSGQEVVSDISVTTHPNTSFFVLNDFVTVGDAIRIKLPHFDWGNTEAWNEHKKNQYLWLENHQLVNEFDHNRGSESECGYWQPGLHAYIQSGKDLIDGDVYGGSFAEPNDLNDWLFPLSAEGRHDYFYSLSDTGTVVGNCAWNNESLPFSEYYPDATKRPNPFTGFADGVGSIDSNGDGVINEDDTHQPRFQKWLGIPTPGSPPSSSVHFYGDEFDAFTTAGQKISISTNPSPMPVYTQREGASSPSNYDNRSIQLNNISVSIVDDDYYNVGNSGPKSLLVSVKFDDKFIEKDVRWCGNVVLRNDPMDPINRPMQIYVKHNRCITLDKGLSPTKLNEVTPDSGDFTDDSYLHLLDGSIMTLESFSRLKVINGSTFHVQDGATLIIGPDSSVEVDASSFICIEDGANIVFQSPTTSAIVIDGNWYGWDYNVINAVLSSSANDYFALNDITTSGTSEGVTMPSSGNVIMEAGNSIVLSPNTVISVNSGQTFRASIVAPPYDCTSVDNYDELLPPDVPGSAASDFGEHSHDHQSGNVTAGEVGEENENFLDKMDDLALFPNPTSGLTYLQYKEIIGNPVEVFVYDSLGKLILSKQFKSDMHVMSIQTNEWEAGLYIVQIARKDKIDTRKLMVR